MDDPLLYIYIVLTIAIGKVNLESRGMGYKVDQHGGVYKKKIEMDLSTYLIIFIININKHATCNVM